MKTSKLLQGNRNDELYGEALKYNTLDEFMTSDPLLFIEAEKANIINIELALDIEANKKKPKPKMPKETTFKPNNAAYAKYKTIPGFIYYFKVNTIEELPVYKLMFSTESVQEVKDILLGTNTIRPIRNTKIELIWQDSFDVALDALIAYKELRKYDKHFKEFKYVGEKRTADGNKDLYGIDVLDLDAGNKMICFNLGSN